MNNNPSFTAIIGWCIYIVVSIILSHILIISGWAFPIGAVILVSFIAALAYNHWNELPLITYPVTLIALVLVNLVIMAIFSGTIRTFLLAFDIPIIIFYYNSIKTE